MPYDSLKDNLLKQLCEVQLLMTLIIAIILRTDLEGDVIVREGYDIILVCVNVFMVPGFLGVAAASGVVAAAILLYGWMEKKKILILRQQAIEELSKGRADSDMAKELQKKAADDKKKTANEAMREKLREAEDKQRAAKRALRLQAEKSESDELARGMPCYIVLLSTPSVECTSVEGCLIGTESGLLSQ
eukprot:COSAG05_NODE_428_length_9890_cov_4.534470_8_plen_189_part_00